MYCDTHEELVGSRAMLGALSKIESEICCARIEKQPELATYIKARQQFVSRASRTLLTTVVYRFHLMYPVLKCLLCNHKVAILAYITIHFPIEG